MISFNTESWPTRLTEQMIAQRSATGEWTGVLLAALARERARETPDARAVIDGDRTFTFSQILDLAERLVASLSQRGLKSGDTISFQLPNWWESMVINLAACLGGFVCNPIIPIYRDSEVRFILQDARSKVIFVPERWRGTNYVEMIERLRGDVPSLASVFLVRSESEGYESFAGLLASVQKQLTQTIDANAIKLLLYTSGTTGKPKGVLHSHNTLRAEIDAVVSFWSISDADVMLMPSPVTHITGYLYALELPFACGMTAVLMEQWSGDQAARLIERHAVTLTIGATPFLVELVAAANRSGQPLRSLRLFACGGAPVPPEAIRHARKILPSCVACRIFGSSEAPTISLGVKASDPPEWSIATDGRIVNNEIRAVDPASGINLPFGIEGEILVRGPEVMLGYTDRGETALAFDEDGFFRTGDLGFVSTVDQIGLITVTGRKKDLIIRGGENISPKEIEDILHQHPAIKEAAVVAKPHPRMGETPMAYVVLHPAASLTFDELSEFLNSVKLAKQKYPEELVIVEDLPRTVTGKVLKYALRDRRKG